MRSRTFRFLFVTADTFPPFRPDVERLFGSELLRRGHHIDWIMQGTRADARTGPVEWRGCRVWVAPTNAGSSRLARLRKHLLALRNDMRLFSLLGQNDYDFVQVKDKFIAALMAAIVPRRKRVPFFFWLSFPYPEEYSLRARSAGERYPIFNRLRALFVRTLLYGVISRAADHIFVQSEEMKRRMAMKGVPLEKMTAVPMGVDLRELAAAPAPSEATPVGEKVVLYLGSLDRMRGLEFLLSVFAHVTRTHPTATLCLVGDSHNPEDRIFLETEAARLSIRERVRFTGFLPRDQAFEHVRRAVVCVSPIRPDPVYDVASPTKIIEYLALGKPVVANDQPDQRQVLEESGGGLCTRYEVDAFASAICWMLENPAEATRMAAKGREYVARTRAYEMLAANLEACYERLLGSPTETPRAGDDGASRAAPSRRTR